MQTVNDYEDDGDLVLYVSFNIIHVLSWWTDENESSKQWNAI